MQILWIVMFVLAAVVVVGLLVRYLVRYVAALRPWEHLEELPATPLERLGWVGLAVSGSIGVGLAVMVALTGAAGFYEDDSSRRIFTLMLLLGVGVWTAAWRLISRAVGGAVIDERDRAILARSFSVESVVVILTLVAWTITLTEVYGDEGSVPIGYLQLIFWSTFIVGAFGRSLGIVLGYRQERLVDA